MQRIWFVILTVIFLCSIVFAEENIPSPYGWVNDFANVISSEYENKLTALIEELEEKTSAEIAVVTIDSIASYNENEYARLLFDKWKPGKRGKDSGVLILVTIKERRWRIETGYGIEGILPDGLCGEIGRDYMVPYFKEGKYSEGLYQGALKIAQVIAKDANVQISALGDFQEHFSEKNTSSDSIVLILILFLLVIGFVILTNYLLYKQRKNGHYYRGEGYAGGSLGGGGFGGGGGGGGFGGFGGGGGGGGGAGGGF